MNTVVVILFVVAVLAAWWASATHKAWIDWRNTLDRVPVVRAAFFAALRRAVGWVTVLLLLAAAVLR